MPAQWGPELLDPSRAPCTGGNPMPTLTLTTTTRIDGAALARDLRDIRQAMGWSVTELARRMDATGHAYMSVTSLQRTIRRWESGRQTPRTYHVDAIALVLLSIAVHPDVTEAINAAGALGFTARWAAGAGTCIVAASASDVAMAKLEATPDGGWRWRAGPQTVVCQLGKCKGFCVA